MFKAKLKEASVLKKIVESIKDFVTIVNIDILPTGIFIQSLDQIKVSLVMLEMKSSGFVEYDVDLPLVLGINFSNLSTIMKFASNEDSVTLIAYDNPDHLYITFENEERHETTTFNLNLFNIDSDNFNWGEIDDPTIVQMPSSKFAQIIIHFQSISDTGNH